MATFIADFTGDTIGQAPAGFTSRWATTGTLLVQSVSGTPNGVAAVATPSGSGRKFWSLDAAGTPAQSQVRALVRTQGFVNSDATGLTMAVVQQGSGAGGTETGLAGGLNKANTSSLQGNARSTLYTSGTAASEDGSPTATLFNVWLWLISTYDGSTHTVEVREVGSGFSEGALLSSYSQPRSAGAGRPGIFNGSANSGRILQVGWLSVGTDGDTAPVYGSSGQNLNALTLSANSAVEGASATLNILGATATSTIALQSGSLPTGMTLDGAARTISGTPTTPGTYNFTLRETLAGYDNSPRDTALSITITAAGLVTELANDCECANANLSTSTVTNANSATPICEITVRPETWTGQPQTGGNTFVVRLKGVLGKQPIVRFLRSSRRLNNNGFGADYTPVWTPNAQPGRNWTQFPTRTITTNHIEVQFPNPLTVNEVIVSTHPLQGNTDFAAMIGEFLADPRWKPGVGANAQGVIATSPAETVAGSPVGANPIYTIVWDDGRQPLDGGPKRVLVMHAHIHAGGEAMSGLRCWSALNWFMNDPSSEADALRRNFVLILNGPQQPNGVRSGHNRWSVSRSPIDFNRCWTFSGADTPEGSPAEIVAAQANLQANVEAMGRRIDCNMSWHTNPGVPTGSEIWYTPEQFSTATRTPIYNRFLTQAQSRLPDLTLTEGNSSTTPTQSNWARVWGNAALAFPCEQGGWGDTRPATQTARGAQWMQAVRDMDAGVGNGGVSWFTDWTVGQAVSGVPHLRTRRRLPNGTHNVRLRATEGVSVAERSFVVTVAGGAITSIVPA